MDLNKPGSGKKLVELIKLSVNTAKQRQIKRLNTKLQNFTNDIPHKQTGK